MEAKKKKEKLRPFEFIDLSGKKRKLTKRQWDFCVEYLENRGVGYKAAEVAGYKGNNKVLRGIASENLTKPDIIEWLSAHLEKHGYSDAHVDQELLYLIKQNSNLHAKRGAIDTYYKRYGKFLPEKQDVVVRIIRHGDRD